MNPRIAALPEGHPRRIMEEQREAQKTDPAFILAEVTRAVQARLDAFAATRGYDGILSACTYAGSGVPRLAAEGQCAVNLRDATWGACYSIMAAVQAGQRALPTVDDVLAELPALGWPQ